jgi:hypothetical protein
MEEIVNNQVGNRQKSDVVRLIFKYFNSATIEGITAEFTSLRKLVIKGCGIQTLEGFPALPQLNNLNLCGNQIADGLHFLIDCKNLVELWLEYNRIKDEQQLYADLTPMVHLKHLHLLGNPSFRSTNPRRVYYRKEVMEALPRLDFVDWGDKNDEILGDELSAFWKRRFGDGEGESDDEFEVRDELSDRDYFELDDRFSHLNICGNVTPVPMDYDADYDEVQDDPPLEDRECEIGADWDSEEDMEATSG